MKVHLKPFKIPNYVIQEMPPANRGDGFKESPSHHLREVDAETLSDMCDEFRRAVFAKAEKCDPAS